MITMSNGDRYDPKKIANAVKAMVDGAHTETRYLCGVCDQTAGVSWVPDDITGERPAYRVSCCGREVDHQDLTVATILWMAIY